MFDTDSESSNSDEESNSSEAISLSLSDTDDESDVSDENGSESSDNSDESSDDEDESESELDDSFNNIDLNSTSTPKLEDIAYVAVAIALWNHATVQIPGIITNHNEWYRSSKDEVPKWTNQLPVPKPLSICIENHFSKILSTVKNWISYHFRAVFFSQGSSSELYHHVNCFVWNPNGTINCKETARNLLNSNLLTNQEKYRLACTYCLVEDIERLWPLVDENDLMDEGLFHRYPLIYYWDCYCSTDLGRMLPLLVDSPIDEFMIRHRHVDNWPAKEYFFNRLSVEDQVMNAIWLIDNNGIDYQKVLLMKLNEFQRLHVYLDRCVEIISNYACTENNENNAISTWYDVRDLISQEQFVSLCKELLVDNGFVLTKVWTSAYDVFKRHVLVHNDYYFIRKTLKFCNTREKNGGEIYVDFLYTVLRDNACLDIKRKITQKKFFFKFCKDCISEGEFELLNCLINVCFPEVDDCNKFKLSFVKIAKKKWFLEHCEKLMKDGQIENLARLLNFCLPKTYPESMQMISDILKINLKHLDDQCLAYYLTGNVQQCKDFLAPLVTLCPEIILDYKSKLLLSKDGIKACNNHFSASIDVLAAIVADGLPSNSKLVADFKRIIIFTDENIDKLINLISGGHLNNVKRFVDWFLKSNRDRKKLKARLIDRLQQGIRRIYPQTRRKILEFL